ncbi:MAG: hypothetical protein JXK93_05370 [Sphaerochaetaceae bacterium]|nr:hypothetical protein [Sphaerochaetaceae bacterium]
MHIACTTEPLKRTGDLKGPVATGHRIAPMPQKRKGTYETMRYEEEMMSRSRRQAISLLVFTCTVILLLLTLTACEDVGLLGHTSLVIHVEEPSRSIFDPSIPMDIAGYRITLTSGETSVTHETSAVGSVTFEALSTGQWTVTIDAFNGWDEVTQSVSGQVIGHLSDNGNGEYTRAVTLSRGEVKHVHASIVPRTDGSGSLSLTVNWPLGGEIITHEPILKVRLTSFNEFSDVYENTVPAVEPKETVLSTAAHSYTFTGLAPGWYQIHTELKVPDSSAGDASVYYRRIDFARVVPDDAEGTRGEITITNEMLETGTAGWTFSEQMQESLTDLSITHDTKDSLYFTGHTQTFLSTYTSDTAEYQWYVDARPVTGATGSSFQTSFSDHGAHTVTVAVREGDVINGAQKELSILPAYEIGDRGIAGGFVFYQDPGDFYPWTYLEAAPHDIVILSEDPLTVTCDITNEGYATGDPDILFGYYRESPEGENIQVTTEPFRQSAMSNTLALVSAMGSAAYTAETGSETTEAYAAKACDILEYNGYDDWALPSQQQMTLIIEDLMRTGIGNLDSGTSYWSSRTYSATSSYYGKYAGSNATADNSTQLRVRATRSF